MISNSRQVVSADKHRCQSGYSPEGKRQLVSTACIRWLCSFSGVRNELSAFKFAQAIWFTFPVWLEENERLRRRQRGAPVCWPPLNWRVYRNSMTNHEGEITALCQIVQFSASSFPLAVSQLIRFSSFHKIWSLLVFQPFSVKFWSWSICALISYVCC